MDRLGEFQAGDFDAALEIQVLHQLRQLGVRKGILFLQSREVSDLHSFDGQRNKFVPLAEKFDSDIPAELMIQNKGYSARTSTGHRSKSRRPQLSAATANAVAFPWVDRFARDVEGRLAVIRQSRELGADVLLGDLGWHQDAGWFKMQMNMHLAVAQYQRDDIAVGRTA